MEKQSILKRIWPIVKERRLLRTLSLSNMVFMILIALFLFSGSGYGNKIEFYREEIGKNEQLLISLQQLVLNQDGHAAFDINLFTNKAFAGYEEVVPFVPFIETMLADVDPSAEVAIKSSEEQIFVDHYADYRVNLKVTDKEAFFEAMNELYGSRFVTKLLNFTMHYKSVDSDGNNKFTEAEFTLRLYLK